MLYMDPSLDTQSLSTATSSSTPHTPSPSMNEQQPTSSNPNASSSSGSNTVEYGSFEPSQSSAQFYLDYPSSQQQQQQQQQHHHQPPMLSIDVSHSTSSTAPSAAVAVGGSLYRRASFPFVQHDHSMSDFANKYAQNDQQQLIPEAHHHHHHAAQHRYESGYEDQVDLDHHHHHHPHSASAMVVPTQQMLPQQHPPHLFYRPSSSSSSSVSSVSAPPSSFLNPAMSSIPVMHTDDAASKETQYLRRKCFNCGTTEPPSWRRSTLNPGKIVCNKCGLYERTHNKPRPHQFGLRPGNKTRKQPPQGQQPHHHHHHQQQPAGRLSGLSSPSSSPKRHGMSVKKEQLDYSQAMRRGSIASINSGSGASDWDDHSGYSTASSAYHSTLGMAPPFGTHQQHSPAQQHQQQHGLSHHHQGHSSSHVPNHHGHHPYNSAYSMPPPPRSTSHGIRLPQAPPMKVPATGNKAGSSSPVTAPGVNVISGGGNNSHSNHLAHIHTNTSSGNTTSTGNARHSSSPDNMSMLSPSALAAGGLSGSSPYGSSSTGGPSSSVTGGGSGGGVPSSASSSSYSPGSTIFLRGPPQPTPLAPPPMMASADYYARRGSTSQIPHHHHHSASSSSLYHEADMSTMRRGSVGAIGMGGGGMSGYGHGSPFGNNNTGSGGGHHHRAGLPPPSSWNSHYSSAGVPLSEMSLTPTPAPAGGSNSNTSADSTPQLGYANVTSATIGDLTPSPPTHHTHHNNGASASPPIGASIQPEIASLAV